MRHDLHRLEDTAWIDHFVKDNYEGTWSVLPLRAPAGARHPVETIYSDPSCEAFVDTPLLEQSPNFRDALARFHCRLDAVRLMRLTPGSVIKPHNDHDLGAEFGKVRLHIPIVTNAEVDFRLNRERVFMHEGECWYLRLSDTHSVTNRGKTDRIHLVIDATLNAWLEELLVAADLGVGGKPSPLIGPAAGALNGWIPFRVRAEEGGEVVDWCDLGDAAFTEPFFEDTVRKCLNRPLAKSSTRQTPIDTLMELKNAQPGIPPTAFIFHTSRCGSTLFSQLAAALPATVVISEAPPIDQILRGGGSAERRIELLQALLSALRQPRRGDERHFFVKFDAWHTMDLPLVRRAFPKLPFVFLYREPAEVIASQMRMPGIHMIPGMLDPSLLGLDLPGVLQLEREEHCARVLALIYAAALTHARSSGLTLMNYDELPDAASRKLLEWCGLTATEEIRERLQRVSEFDAKTPSLPFDPADAAIRLAPSARAIEAARRFVAPYYQQLEALRASQ